MEACCALRRWSPAKSLRLLRRGGGGAAADSTGAPAPPRLSTATISMANFSCARRRRAYEGLLLDAGGTLLQLARPVEETYASIGRKYGLNATESQIKQGFRRAFAAPWPEKLRYQGDGRAFWRLVVAEAIGCADNDYFEEVYEHFAHGDAWRLPVGAYEAMHFLKDSGVKLAVVSNFDTRLRKLLKDLDVADLFDAIIVSSEVGYEKPAPEIFQNALEKLGAEAAKAVHVGDDEKADKAGANAIGIDCWWGAYHIHGHTRQMVEKYSMYIKWKVVGQDRRALVVERNRNSRAVAEDRRYMNLAMLHCRMTRQVGTSFRLFPTWEGPHTSLVQALGMKSSARPNEMGSSQQVMTGLQPRINLELGQTRLCIRWLHLQVKSILIKARFRRRRLLLLAL